jgi:hypothetical protein
MFGRRRSVELTALARRALVLVEVGSAYFVFEAAVAAAKLPDQVVNASRRGTGDQDLSARILITFDKAQSRHREAL